MERARHGGHSDEVKAASRTASECSVTLLKTQGGRRSTATRRYVMASRRHQVDIQSSLLDYRCGLAGGVTSGVIGFGGHETQAEAGEEDRDPAGHHDETTEGQTGLVTSLVPSPAPSPRQTTHDTTSGPSPAVLPHGSL